jgi:hypothetical protein
VDVINDKAIARRSMVVITLIPFARELLTSTSCRAPLSFGVLANAIFGYAKSKCNYYGNNVNAAAGCARRVARQSKTQSSQWLGAAPSTKAYASPGIFKLSRSIHGDRSATRDGLEKRFASLDSVQ